MVIECPHASDVHKSQVMIFAGAKIIFQAGRPAKASFKGKRVENYIYSMKRLNGGSDRYGKCECCGKQVDSTYLLKKMKVYTNHAGVESATYYLDLFGHKKCLANVTRP